MSKQLTAVEWLIDKLTDEPYKFLFLSDKPDEMNELIKLIKKAKVMEKQQIIDAFWNGDNSDCTSEQNSKEFAEQYYSETFKK
jgi:hypothetical protein